MQTEIADYSSVILEGKVVKKPYIIRGGHIFFEIENKGCIQCAAFEPTKGFRDTVRNLIVGDHIRVYGVVKYAGKLKPRKLYKLLLLECKKRKGGEKEMYAKLISKSGEGGNLMESDNFGGMCVDGNIPLWFGDCRNGYSPRLGYCYFGYHFSG